MLSQRSKWPYRLQQARSFARNFLLDLVSGPVNKHTAKLWHKGILINDLAISAQAERTAFQYRLLADALRFIERRDKRRFRRIQRETRLTLITHLPNAAASYYRFARRIDMNTASSLFLAAEECGTDGEHYEWHVAHCACVLVHEATHGALGSRYVPYNKATRLRVERLCTREEQRFAERLPRTHYAYNTGLVRPFDAARWESSWNTTMRLGQRLALCVAVMRDSLAGREPLSPNSLSGDLLRAKGG